MRDVIRTHAPSVTSCAHPPLRRRRRARTVYGLLLRSDLHTLFDLGYITVDPDEKKIIVSNRIREEFENGRDYYKLNGQPLIEPRNISARPLIDSLGYHAQEIFLG